MSNTGQTFATASLGVVVRAMMIPVIRLPAPTGAHPVGAMDRIVAGTIPITIWYPARVQPGARRAAYRSEVKVHERSMRQQLLFPFVRPSSYLEVPVAVADGRHAVVLYVPGWGDKRSDNTALCEELASHSFIVAAIDDQQPKPPMDFSSGRALDKTLRLANSKVRTQSLDLSKVLTELERVSPGDPAYRVTSTMDFRRIAALGLSFGGATAAEAALHDSRIRAAVNLDGWTFGDAAQNGVGKPFMIISTGAATVDQPKTGGLEARCLGRYETELDRKNSEEILSGFRRHGGYFVTVDGARHENFGDAGFLPLKRRPAGSIDGRRAARIVAAYTNEFFGFVLNGRPAGLLTQPTGQLSSTSRSGLDPAAEITIWTSPSATSAQSASSS